VRDLDKEVTKDIIEKIHEINERNKELSKHVKEMIDRGYSKDQLGEIGRLLKKSNKCLKYALIYINKGDKEKAIYYYKMAKYYHLRARRTLEDVIKRDKTQKYVQRMYEQVQEMFEKYRDKMPVRVREKIETRLEYVGKLIEQGKIKVAIREIALIRSIIRKFAVPNVIVISPRNPEVVRINDNEGTIKYVILLPENVFSNTNESVLLRITFETKIKDFKIEEAYAHIGSVTIPVIVNENKTLVIKIDKKIIDTLNNETSSNTDSVRHVLRKNIIFITVKINATIDKIAKIVTHVTVGNNTIDRTIIVRKGE